MDMGSRRMQIVGIVLAVLMAALLAVTLWVYRPVSLAEAADARTGLEPKVVVVVRLDEMDGNGTSHEYQAYDPALLEQAKKDYLAKLDGETYRCPLPDDLQPGDKSF